MAGATAPLLCPVAVAGNTINVSSFVADPNNAGTGIQNALNALATSGNNILSFSVGVTYTVNSFPTIANKSGWKILGNGATIKAANGLAVSFQNHQLKITACADVVIDTLYFDGNRANRSVAEQEGQTVGVYDSDRISFLTCKFDNSPGSDGIQISGLATNEPDPTKFCTDILLFNCSADNNYRGGCFIRNAYNAQVRGGSYTNANGTSPQFGIGIEPNSGSGGGADACRDILIDSVTFTNNVGIHSYAGAVVPIKKITWKGCRFNDAGNGPSDGEGSCLRGTATDVLVQGNTFESVVTTSRSAINVQGGFIAGDASNWIIDTNSFNSCDFATSVIYFFNGTGHVASNNKFFNCPDTHVAGSVSFTETNSQTVGARSDPTPTPPTTATLSHCVVGGGARGVVYAEQLTRATVTNNATPQAVLSLAHVPPSNTTWWYFGGGLLDNSVANGNGVFARLRNQTQATDYGNAKYSTNDVTNSIPITFAAEQAYGASPSTQTVSMDIWTTGAETVGLDEIHLLGLQKDTLDLYANSDAETNENTAVFTDKVSLAGPATGQYLIIFTAETKAQTGTNIEIRATDGTDFYGTANYSMQWSVAFDRFRTWSAAIVTTPVGRTFKIQWRSTVAAQGVSIRNARIFMLCLDSWRANYYSESLARATTTSTTAQDKGLLTQVTGAGDHLAFAGMILDGNNNGFACNATFERDGAIGYSQVETVRAANERCGAFFTFRKENLTAASHTWKTRYFSENVALTTGAAQSFISIIDINPFTLSVFIDAVLRDSGALFLTMDAVLQKQIVKTALLGAVLTGTPVKTASLDAILQGASTTLLQTQISAILKGTVTKQASMDVVLVGGIPLTASIDAIFKKEQSKTAVVDAVLAGNLVSLTKISFMSAKLSKRFDMTVQMDAMLATGGLAVTGGLDAILSAEWLPEASGEHNWTNQASREEGWQPATPVEDGWSDA